MFRTNGRLALIVAAPALVAAGLAVAQTAPQAEGPPAATPAQVFFGGHGGGGHGGGHGGRHGGGHGAGMHAMFAEVDADGDGRVTQGEVDAFRAAELAAADTDGDGAVWLEEFAVVYAARMRPRMVDAFQSFDDDGDGLVTAAELDARFGGVVARLDRNDDDALSLEDRGPRGDRR